jgi:hypothetical protein
VEVNDVQIVESVERLRNRPNAQCGGGPMYRLANGDKDCPQPSDVRQTTTSAAGRADRLFVPRVQRKLGLLDYFRQRV